MDLETYLASNAMKRSHYFLLIGLLISSCYDELDYSFEKVEQESVISEILFSKEALLANEQDSLLIHAVVPENADNELAEVTIIVTKGSFLSNGEKKITGKPSLTRINGEKKRAFSAALQADAEVGPAYIVVEVAGVQSDTTLEFNRNNPTKILITPSSLGIVSELNAEIEVEVALTSDNGKVSQNHPFEILALDSLGQQVGTYRIKNTSCPTNICVSKFTVAPDTAYSGTITLRAETELATSILSDEVTIYSTKP